MKNYKRLLAAVPFVLILMLAACVQGTPTAEPTQATGAGQEETSTAAPTQESTQEPTQAPTEEEKEKVTITVWLEDNELFPLIEEKIVEPFNEQSTTTIVEAVPSANLWDTLRTSLPAGEGPDIISTMGPTAAASLAQTGYLLPMDEYAEKYNWAEEILPWALKVGEVDGKLYSIPKEVETLVLYYNKTLFEEHDWQPPNTTEELIALCEEIEAAGVIPFAHATGEYRGAHEWYIGEFLNHVAGPEKVYEGLTGEGSWEDPALIEAIELLNTFQQNGWFMGGLDRYYTLTFAERDAMFVSGEAAMDIEGTWNVGVLLGLFEDSPNEWDWVPVPSSTGSDIYDLGVGGSLSINKQSENPDNAAEFIEYYYSPEVQAILVSDGWNPAPVKLSAEALSGVDLRYAEIIEEMGKASAKNDYGYTTWTFWPPETEAYLVDGIEKVWAGEITAAEFMGRHQQLFNEELEEGEVPVIPER